MHRPTAHQPRRLAAAVAVAVAFAAASCAYRTTNIAPTIPEVSESSRVYAADGTLLTVLHAEQNRDTVRYDEFPRALIDAVVAIEDKRFWQHNGVDLRGIIRAAGANAAEGEIAQGGSTITQQYVKTALLDPAQTVNRKLREMALAWQLERTSSKELILELYLNTIYFGHGAYGAEAAAQTYFGKSVKGLDIGEAALVAGLVQSPSATDPYVAPEKAVERRNVVLDEMLSDGRISGADHAAARNQSLRLAQEFEASDRFPAAHFVEEVKQFILNDPRFGTTEEARRNLLFGGGLRITTTIDLKLQAQAEAAIQAELPDPQGDPDASLVALEPATGYVRAMVGGRDYFGVSTYAKYNLAVGEGRQAGSTFKPFVLAAALESGVPLSKVYKAPSELEIPLGKGIEPWVVRNYGGSGGGSVNLVEATIRSYNTVYAQLMKDVGPENAVTVAQRLGITSPLQPVLAAVLGTENVTALEMASAYSTFANRGIHVSPALVSKITKADGTVIFEAPHAQERALSTEVSDQVTAVLSQVVSRGTGTAARLDRSTAGKTGTAEGYRDAWFVGFTPELTTAVWVGFPQGQIPMVPPTTAITVTGGSWPAEIWQRFMTEATADTPATEFVAPKTAVRSVVEAPQPAPTTTTAGPPTSVKPEGDQSGGAKPGDPKPGDTKPGDGKPGESPATSTTAARDSGARDPTTTTASGDRGRSG